jgi:hypothetical protein
VLSCFQYTRDCPCSAKASCGGWKVCPAVRKKVIGSAAILLFIAACATAQVFEIGAVASGGLCFATGSFFDAKAAQLAEMGAASPGTQGSSTAGLFPGWAGGGYAEMIFAEWFSMRLELELAFQGASRLALTESGTPFDRYGMYYFSVALPLFAKARIPLAGGVATVSVGPFLGLVVSDIVLVDRYAEYTTTASVSQDFFYGIHGGAAGGAGYSHSLGPGIASLELRAVWALLPAASQSGSLGGEIFPLSFSLAAGYGFRLKGGGE